MAAGATYEPIATTTLASAAATITFSSIPATYTDLRVIWIGTGDSGNSARIKFNSDAGTNYSYTVIYGDGTTAASARGSNQSNIYLSDFAISGMSATIPQLATADIFSYAGSTNKTVLTTVSNDLNGSGVTLRTVQLWRSISAINRIDITAGAGNFKTGTTATLYGIKAA